MKRGGCLGPTERPFPRFESAAPPQVPSESKLLYIAQQGRSVFYSLLYYRLQTKNKDGQNLKMTKRNRSINVQEHILSNGVMSSELKEFLKNAAVEMKENAVDYKQPPWAAFPEYERHSMGWRMGPGEDYWHAFHSWIRSLRNQDADAFISRYPEPEDWKGFYDNIGFSR